MRSTAFLAFLLLVPACGGLTAGEITSSSDPALADAKEDNSNDKAGKKDKGGDQDDDAQCDGYAVCDDGNSYFSEKECTSAAPGSVCKRHPKETCGTKVWCPENEVDVCTAAPTCAGNEDGFKTEDDCKSSSERVGCRAVTMCNQTIWCGQRSVQCAAIPSCKDGETEFKSEADCKKRKGAEDCRSLTVCGVTIGCGTIPAVTP